MISDDDGNTLDESLQTEDDSDDNAFGIIREAGKPLRSGKKQLGPPITIDEKLETLNTTHRQVVEHFMYEATELSKKASLRNRTPLDY